MAQKYKLTYFPVRGVAEPCRFILAYMNADFEDKRVPFADWPRLKPISPYHKMPFIEIDGKIVNQSVAISRYLGKQAGIAGSDEWERFLIDATVETIRDAFEEFCIYFMDRDPTTKADKMVVFKNETLPNFLKTFEVKVKENGGFLVNGKLSWGDLYFVSLFDFVGDSFDLNLSKYPALNNLFHHVFNIPGIKSWMKNRPIDVDIP